VQVEGSYSCFRGDEERRLFLNAGKAGVNTGVLEPFNVTGVAGLGDRWGGGGGGSSFCPADSSTFSLLDLRYFLRVSGGADAGNARGSLESSKALIGVVGWLVLRDRGILGSSIEGTEETLLWALGRWGDVGGEPGGEAVSSPMDPSSSSESSEYSTSEVGIQTL
jgi:hypothetical protein